MVRFGLERRRGRGSWFGFVHPLRASHASPSLREGEENGVLCFSLDSRVRGNDGGRAPLPFASRRGGVGGCILEVVLVDPNCAGRVFLRRLNRADDPY